MRRAGRYLLFDQIASGGMASVYVARLIGPIGFSRTVAIKQLHPHLTSDAGMVTMLVDEARLTSRIQHPNVVAVNDIVLVDRELLLVMDYIHGEALSRLVQREHPVPVPIANAVMIGALQGLHAAHEARSEQGQPLGLVHRDVSPQNILVGADGVTRVVDFGIAKAAERLQPTTGGQLKGKAAYLAPEQICEGDVDRRTDVYAASVVLWELLAGRRLFDAPNALDTMRRVLETKHVTPSRHAPSVPAAVDAVVMRGLASQPDARFATAWDMAVALEQAGPHASTREVTAWVEMIAGDVLRERAQRVAEIERVSSSADASHAADATTSQAWVAAIASDASAKRTAQDDIPTVHHGPTPALPTRRSRRRIGLAVAAIGGLAAITIVGAAAMRSGSDDARSEGTPPAPAVEAPARPTHAVEAPVQPSPTHAAEPPAEPPAQPSTHSRSRPAASAHKPTKPAKKSAAKCAEPFVWGADGTKIPKPECL